MAEPRPTTDVEIKGYLRALKFMVDTIVCFYTYRDGRHDRMLTGMTPEQRCAFDVASNEQWARVEACLKG